MFLLWVALLTLFRHTDCDPKLCRLYNEAHAQKCGRCLFKAKMMTVEPPPVHKRVWVNSSQPHRLALAIIEPRRHPLFHRVIWSFSHVYGGNPNTSLWIFHGSENELLLRDIISPAGGWQGTNFVNLAVHNLNGRNYSNIMYKQTFWDHLMSAEYVLVFQTDSAIFGPVPDEYFRYDYVGAPWNWNVCHKGNCSRVGNGGLSLRNVAQQRALAAERDWIEDQNEDIYFAIRTQNRAPIDVAMRFAVESIFYMPTN